MTHSSEEAWALDDGHRGRVGDHTARGFCTDPAGAHAPHAAEAILGYEPTGLYSQRRIDCESYCVTVTQLNSDLLLPGANPGSASSLCQPPTERAELTLIYGLQLLDSESGFDIPELVAERVDVD